MAVLVVKTDTAIVKVQRQTKVVKVTEAGAPQIIPAETGAPQVIKVTRTRPPRVKIITGVGGGGVTAPNLFVQEEQPVFTTPGLWVELRANGSVKTIWANV